MNLSSQKPTSSPNSLEDIASIMLQPHAGHRQHQSLEPCLRKRLPVNQTWEGPESPLQRCQAHRERHSCTCHQIHLLLESHTALGRGACPGANGLHICRRTCMSWLLAHASCSDAIGLQASNFAISIIKLRACSCRHTGRWQHS